MLTQPPLRWVRIVLVVLLALVGAVSDPAHAGTKRDFSVSAHRYAFVVAGSDVPEIKVQKGDIVRIVFSAEDIPHSFTIVNDDHYRISRRAEPGKPVPIEFLADRAGRFEFKCTLSIDEKCKDMDGWIIVTEAR